MSVHHLSAVADLSDLPPTCKLVLFGMAIDADRRGYVRTTNPMMQQRTGLSERAVRDTMKKLIGMGYVVEALPSGHRLILSS